MAIMRATLEKSQKNPSPAASGGRNAKRRTRLNPARTPAEERVNLKSILVPIDFSAESKKALVYALPFATLFKAKLTLLHVVEPVALPDFAKSFPLVLDNDEVTARCKRHMEEMLKNLNSGPQSVEKVLVRYGSAFNEISEAARTLKCDLIIISTHGYTGIKHVLLGSTTERVVRHAPCPVLVVRPREHEFVLTESNL
jgi:universal stress protein A